MGKALFSHPNSNILKKSVFIKRGDYVGKTGIVLSELKEDVYEVDVSGKIIALNRSDFVIKYKDRSTYEYTPGKY